METFVNDTVYIVLETFKVVTGYATMRIKYEDPDGDTGYWDAEECPASSTCLRTKDRVKCDTNGKWRVQAYLADADEAYHGKFAEFKVYTPLC